MIIATVITSTKPGGAAPLSEVRPEEAVALFKEAKLRARRRRMVWGSGAIVALVVVGVGIAGGFGAFSGSPSRTATRHSASSGPRAVVTGHTGLVSCSGAAVFAPKTFIISCADANSELKATHWTSWTGSRARGTTTFGLNLCDPYCAASRISFFPGSKVALLDPVTTSKGPRFSKLVVSYLLHGKATTFTMSWKGDPTF